MAKTDESLYGALCRLAESDIVPMHMPGHKRNTALLRSASLLQSATLLRSALNDAVPDGAVPLGAVPLGAVLPYGIDITEIDGFDNLHHPTGILRALSETAARMYGAAAAFPLCAGSTCGILAAVRGMVRPGERVLVGRNAHMSVFHALALAGAEPVYLSPEADAETGIVGALSAQTVARGLCDAPDAKLVILTSPTYEGAVSPVDRIASFAHAAGARVLVDAAHGAHLGFSDAFPPAPLAQGADAVVLSLHKTLPAMTGCALALAADGETAAAIAEQLDVFQTSSPSYVLLASVDVCLRLLRERGGELFDAWQARLARFRLAARDWKNLRLYPSDDPGKIVILTGGLGRSGREVAALLRERYRIEPEAAWTRHLLAMTSVCDTDEGFARLTAALAEIDRMPGEGVCPPPLVYGIPQTVVPLSRAERAARETVPLARAVGRISGGYVIPYPPGIPVLLPGERITADITDVIGRALAAGEVQNTGNTLPQALTVLCDT